VFNYSKEHPNRHHQSSTAMPIAGRVSGPHLFSEKEMPTEGINDNDDQQQTTSSNKHTK